MSLGLIIGRFQPFHDRHADIICDALAENDKVLILVGSANKLPDYRNPFPVDTRVELLETYFEGEDAITIRKLDDFPTDMMWVEQVNAEVLSLQEDPTKVTLYTGCKDHEFYEEHFLFPIKSHDSKGISATQIRAMLFDGDICEELLKIVPTCTYKLLKDFRNDNPEYERLWAEYHLCTDGKSNAVHNHAFANPIEPVVHTAVLQNNKLLLVKRGGTRGHGQWALPGGFLDMGESTRAGALRELREETGVDLTDTSIPSKELIQVVSENLGGLSTRTLGINYLYVVHNDCELEITAGDDADDVQWFDLGDILQDKQLLFYNHGNVVKQLFGELGGGNQ